MISLTILSCLRSSLNACAQHHQFNQERDLGVSIDTPGPDFTTIQRKDVMRYQASYAVTTDIQDMHGQCGQGHRISLCYQHLILCHEGDMFQLILNLLSNLHGLIHRIVINITQTGLFCSDSLCTSCQIRDGCKIVVRGEVPEECR